MKQFLFLLFLSCLSLPILLNAQLTVDLELRPRLEYRHGYKTLVGKTDDPATSITQRTRLNVLFQSDFMDARLSAQDVRVWGDVGQLNTGDLIGLSLHEAWAKIFLGDRFSFKVGRQEVSYDDQRIFGAVNWAQQGRSHDLLKLSYLNNRFKADLGLAFNQEREQLTGTYYNIGNQYKAMQYLWVHHSWDNFKSSFLFLNNGKQSKDTLNLEKTLYSQTLGTYMKYDKNKFQVDGSFFFQAGSDEFNRSISAYLFSLNLAYHFAIKSFLGAGIEVLSGNDNQQILDNTNKAFNPFYGTNHKFNGHMDYFYVGNHINNIGLIDLNVKASTKLGDKSHLKAAIHYFLSPSEFSEKSLGTELDLSYSYAIHPAVKLSVGYSHMFPGEGMKLLKANLNPGTNNWAWTMIAISPKIFQTNTHKDPSEVK